MKQKEAIILSRQPLLYWIPLPRKDNKVYFSLIFPIQENSHFLNEIHLLEHYIMNFFVKNLGKEDVKKEGRVNSQTLEFHFVFPERNFEKYYEKIFEILNNLDFSQQEILKHEKQVLLTEAHSDIKDLSTEIAFNIKKTKGINNNPYFLAEFDNASKIKKITLNDLKNIFERIILKNSPYIFFGGQKQSVANKIRKEIINAPLWLNWKKTKKEKIFLKQKPFKINGLKIQKIFSKKAPSYKNYFIFLFPSFSLKEHFSKRLILEICSEIIFEHPQSDFRNYLRDKFAVYDIEFKNIFYIANGFSFLSFWIVREKTQLIKNFITKNFDWKTMDWNKIFNLWRKEQKQVLKNADSDWQINSKRFRWIVEDLIFEKRVISPRLYKEVLKKTKSETLKKVVSYVFDFKNCYLWIASFK